MKSAYEGGQDAAEGRGLVVVPSAQFQASLEQLASASTTDYRASAQSFRRNLEAAYSLVTLPYLFSWTSLYESRARILLLAQEIEFGAHNEPLTPEQKLEASRRVSRALEAKPNEEERQAMVDSAVEALTSYLRIGPFRQAVVELLLESVVVACGTFETLVTDVVRTTLDRQPSIAAELMTAESTRRHFPSKGISVDSLVRHRFNVADSMGRLLLEDRHLDSLPIIKDVTSVVFQGETELQVALSKPEVWQMFQRRHLVAHRRGEVDVGYLKKTGEEAKEGERLSVTGGYVEGLLVMVRDLGALTLQAAARRQQ